MVKASAITVRDVASRAGVSVSTVSHVVNGTRFVEPATKKRVRDAIEALGFRSNFLARGLRSRITHTLGLVLPDISNPFFAEIGRVIEDIGHHRGYSVILCNSDLSKSREIDYVNVLLSKQIDGLLVISTGNHPDVLDPAKDADVPVVVVDREVDRPGVDTVLLDNRLGGALAARHLLELGHRRVACIAGPSDVSPSAHRVSAFLDEIEKDGIAVCVAIVRGDFRFEGAKRATEELLANGKEFSAIFAANDIMAMAAIGVLKRAMLDVPGDVSVIGFDNIVLAEAMCPSITTISQPIDELGRAAVGVLLDRINEPSRPESHVVVAPTLIKRESTGYARESHRLDSPAEANTRSVGKKSR